MNIIERIRAEIERRMETCDATSKTPNQLLWAELSALLLFLDSLSEEDALPYWKKVHTYTEELHEGDMEKMLLDLSIGKGKRETKIALPDKVVDALEEHDKDLEEEYKEYVENDPVLSKLVNRSAGIIIASHFAEWQAKQFLKSSPLPEDTLIFKKGVEEGKRLMMEDAVEGMIYQPAEHYWAEVIARYDGELKHGDKVRIIILPKEDGE